MRVGLCVGIHTHTRAGGGGPKDVEWHLNSTPRRSVRVRMASFCTSSWGWGRAASRPCMGATTGVNTACSAAGLLAGGSAATTTATPSITCTPHPHHMYATHCSFRFYTQNGSGDTPQHI